ncbi:MAG: class I SAM-dependent methyltransferase [Planctomyces sp.]|jgi:SAM-dependent methyltransferase
MVHAAFPVVDSSSTVECRSCGRSGLKSILSLGSTPLANALLTEDQLAKPELTWPLDLAWCPGCSLVQITESVPPEMMFRDYAYFSSFAETMVQHARRIADHLTQAESLNSESLVVEVASNDGYLLQWYRQQGIPVLGIEPARNIAEVARDQRGIRTISEFFGRELAGELVAGGERADVIHANNVLAHVPDLNGVVAGFKTLLKPSGVIVVEAPYLRDLIDHVEFDTIYHEHLCYFSLTALNQLFSRHGLSIVDVERLTIHGGSLRIFARHMGSCDVHERVTTLLNQEAEWVLSPSHYRQFENRVEKLRGDLVALIKRIKQENRRIAVYGASAKGSTLLNYFGIGSETLEYVVDRSTVKQGRYTPGTRLRIHDPAKLLTDCPDYCLLLTWNFADEILMQQQAYRDQGGKFIIPIPQLRIA